MFFGALLSPAPEHASSTATFRPVADAFVDASRPRANVGSVKRLLVDGRPVVRSYLRFRVAATRGSVVRATLRALAVTNSQRGFSVRSAGNRWGERTITFANAPRVSRAYASSGRVGAGTWARADVTPLVKGDGVVTLVLTTPAARAVALASREASASRRPRLVVVSNSAPQAQARSVTTQEDTATQVALDASDADGDALSYVIASRPSHGTISSPRGNTVTYTPNENYNGDDSLSFKVSDGSLDSNVVSVSLTVSPRNDAPVCVNISLSTPEDTPASALPACFDVDGDAPAYEVAEQGAKGMASIQGGQLHYAPNANANGSDGFKYRAKDGNGGQSSAASVAVTITPVNDAPAARDDSLATDEDKRATVDVVANDSDVDGDSLTVAPVSPPSNGTLSCAATGVCTYTPKQDYNGADSFAYSLSDGKGGWDTATANVSVRSVNDAPVARGDDKGIGEDATLTFPAADLLANDSPGPVDEGSQTLNVTAVAATPSTNGTVSLADGTVTYQPSSDYNGHASFEYTVADNGTPAEAAKGSVTVAVAAVNDAPVCGQRSYETAEDTPLSSVACADADGDELTYSNRVEPANGTFTLAGDGSFTYEPAANYNGSDSFSFEASDGNGGSDSGTVSVSVTPVNDAPVATNDSRTIAEDSAVDANVKGNDAVGPANETGQALTVTAVTDPPNGTARILTAEDNPLRVNYVRYKPDPNYFGSDSFTYIVCDDGQTNGAPDPKCATGTVAVKVTPVDDAPICFEGLEAELVTAENAAVDGVACREVDGDAVTFAFTSEPANGVVDPIADGPLSRFSYTPGVDFNGADAFAFEACDVGTTALLCDAGAARVTVVRVVSAAVETDPVPNDGDAADDPAMRVNPSDPGQSAVIGADKRGGIAVYDLGGRELQYLPEGRVNNVDVRDGFPLGGEPITLVTGSDRSDDGIAAYRLDPSTRTLEDVASGPLEVGLDVYGSCMYRDSDNRVYFFVTSKEGDVEQWKLADDGTGRVAATKVRSFSVGSQSEGCVADDERGELYIGEENVGIWRYGADAADGTDRVLVDSTDLTGHLVKDVEGLAIAYDVDGTDYLFASSQGNSTYTVYRRGDDGSFAFFRSFQVGPVDDGIDGTEETDGIDVTSASLGPDFPGGLFVAQDGVNGAENQNFKLVPLDSVFAG